MAERNLIREGFLFNTKSPSGAVSGTQTLSPLELNRLSDGNTVSPAFVVSGSKTVVVDADLGARWQIDRVEFYSAEASNTNFEIEISDNNLDYRQVPMAGSAGFWSGALPNTTISGAPRYIRYRHHPAGNTTVNELLAINDDTLLDFGADGTQTSLTIDDAPIGKSSDFVETLTLKNNFSKSAEAFAVVDRTFNDAEDEVEISISQSGPWFGRSTGLSTQPFVFPWEKGQGSNVRITTSGVAFFNFINGSANGWLMIGATQSLADGILRGQTTNQVPLAYISSEFVSFVSGETFDASTTRHQNKFVFRAKDADQVRVRARIQTPLQLSNIVEGPRLFWKTEQNVESSPSDFRSALSVLSTAGTAITGDFQDFFFPVSTAPTWSGSIRGLAFRPFTIATGTNVVFDVREVDVYNSHDSSVSLDFNPVASGNITVPLPFNAAVQDTTSHTVVSFRHRITQDCIITKVGLFYNPSSPNAIFLARQLSGSHFPLPGTNFTVPYGINLSEVGFSTTQSNYNEVNVYWQAQKGDLLATTAGALGGEGYPYTQGEPGDAFVSVSGLISIPGISDLTNVLNQNTFTSTARNYLIFYEAIPTELGGYKSSGTYRTPVFDLGQSPALGSLDFDSSTPVGTSVDTSGQSGFDTVRIRASDRPSRSGLKLGEVGLVDGVSPTLNEFPNQSDLFNTSPKNNQQINLQNKVVSDAVSAYVQNLGGAILYNKLADELWVLDCIISGTDPFVNTDARPTWDVFSPYSGEYIRTDHLKGDLTYGYDGDNGEGSSSDGRRFLPIGIEADYERGDIYIFQKIPGFTIGAGQYYGVVADLEGNFKDVFWRSGAVGIPDQSSLATFNERIFAHALGFTYASDLQDPTVTTSGTKGVFFVLHDNAIGTNLGSRFNGRSITALRNGNTVGARNVGVINTTAISSIAGLGFTSSTDRMPTGLVYNHQDGLLYLHFDNTSGIFGSANKRPEFLTVRPTFNSVTFQVDYTLTTLSGTAYGTAPDVNGLSKEFLGADTTGSSTSQQSAVITDRSPTFTMAIAHSQIRDTFVILRSYFGEFSSLFPRSFGSSADTNRLSKHNVSTLVECGTGNKTSVVNGSFPGAGDPLWGTVSGTLNFQEIATEGVNFPTGRYAQVEYQLNSDGLQSKTPALLSSKIAQGLRIGQIPAHGSTDIYVRTNIPAGQSIGDQSGRIKVWLETEE